MPNEIRWQEYFNAYMPTIIILSSLFSLLAHPAYSFPNAIVQILIIFLWMYFVHIFLHKLHIPGPLGILNIHVYLHHDKLIAMPRWLELCIESIANLMFISIILLIPYILNIRFFSVSLVIGVALLYTILHIYEYSIIGNKKHKLHHIHTFCNYEPEYLDTLFGTHCEPDEPYTEMYEEIPHIIVAFCLAGMLKLCMGLD